jgi:methyltransferase (TIGR00027 family)
MFRHKAGPMTQTIQNVSDTAFMVAGFRALENERSKPLFREPLAAKLVGEHGKKILAAVPRHFVGAWSVVIRTVIIDDYIRQAIAAGVDTILNLGAGLDTRPYRIDLPSSLRWIEVDFPHMIELKETRLAGEKPSCRLERISLDLTDRALRRKLFADVSARSNKLLVLTEGHLWRGCGARLVRPESLQLASFTTTPDCAPPSLGSAGSTMTSPLPSRKKV